MEWKLSSAKPSKRLYSEDAKEITAYRRGKTKINLIDHSTLPQHYKKSYGCTFDDVQDLEKYINENYVDKINRKLLFCPILSEAEIGLSNGKTIRLPYFETQIVLLFNDYEMLTLDEIKGRVKTEGFILDYALNELVENYHILYLKDDKYILNPPEKYIDGHPNEIKNIIRMEEIKYLMQCYIIKAVQRLRSGDRNQIYKEISDICLYHNRQDILKIPMLFDETIEILKNKSYITEDDNHMIHYFY